MRRAQWQGQLDAIRDRTHPILAVRIAADARHDPEAVVAFKEFTYEGFIARADHEIDWAERGLRLIDRLRSDGAI